MSDFTPSIPLELQIRKIIFEILKSEGDVDPSWIIDDTESLFTNICDSGLVRNIAQNFTTIFLKLFDPVEKFHCDSCNHDIFLGTSEERLCPNSSCNSTL